MDPPLEEKVVWFQPTTLSPACRFVRTPKAQRILSSCQMWSATPGRGHPIEEFGDNLCPLCKAGKIADGFLVKRK